MSEQLDVEFGRGMDDAVEIQRRFNELDRIMFLQVQMSTSEDPFERIAQIAAAQAEFREGVDALLAARAKRKEDKVQK